VLCRPTWLEVTFERALLFLTRSESGAVLDRAVAAVSSWSGSEPTFTNALRVLVKAEVTEPITKRVTPYSEPLEEVMCFSLSIIVIRNAEAY
jgi:Flp pilus assembly protein TadG